MEEVTLDYKWFIIHTHSGFEAKVIESIREEVKKRKLKTYNCNKPWGDMSIYSDGSVGPCCNLVGRKAPIGNVNNNTIKEIWNGEKMNRIRDGFRNNNPIDVCKVCLESVVINN